MKVHVLGSSLWLGGLKRHIELEGDEVVRSSRGADLSVSDDSVASHASSHVHVGGRYHVPVDLLSPGEINTSDGPCDFRLVRWYNRGLHDTTLLVMPQRGLMAGGLGPPLVTCSLAVPVREGTLPLLLDHPIVLSTLDQAGYVGPVVAEFSLNPLGLRDVYATLQFPDVFHLLESTKMRVCEFLASPVPELLPSWTAMVLLTRYPWPHSETCQRYHVGNVEPREQIEKHFWFFDANVFRHSLYTESTLLGASTAWSYNPVNASKRAMGTCSGLSVPEKQYRNDLHFSGKLVWDKLQALGVEALV